MCFLPQTCTRVLDLLKEGVFGNCPEEAIISYIHHCSKLFPLSTVFNPPTIHPPVASLLTSDHSYLPRKMQVQKADKESGTNVAMSVLSGDINDTGTIVNKASGTSSQSNEIKLLVESKEQKTTASV